MSIQSLFILPICLLISVATFAQDTALALNDTPHNLTNDLSPRAYYEDLVENLGDQHEMEACELTLEKYDQADADEYLAILWNKLAKEAQLMQNHEKATGYYSRVVEAKYKNDTDAALLVVEKQQSIAWRSLRDMSFEQEDYTQAIHFQDKYVDHLNKTNPRQYKNQRLHIDKFYAQAYQAQGKSETAIQHLAPYTFGYASEGWSGLDKNVVDYLVELLKTKYTKKEYKRFLSEIHHAIQGKTVNGEMQFYIQILANEIPFQQDSKNYHTKVPMGVVSKEQAIAHYQNKLFNSYFYRKLMEKY